MSGIAGVFSIYGDPVEDGVLRAMTNPVAYRGPNGIGYWTNGRVGLAQLQFCTTPESLHEEQPLLSRDGLCCIVWDGRLDNREELISTLPPSAASSHGTTDVALVLQAYAVWGRACVKRLIGEFALAIWDDSRRELFCARDPIGLREFHYYYDERRFVFGTEIQQVLCHPDVQNELNMLMIGLHLMSRPGDGKITFYRDILRLQGGYTLVVSENGLHLEPFWQPETLNQIRVGDDEYEEQFTAVFRTAVKSSMRSLGPVAILLSGGIDSSSIACTAEALRSDGAAKFPDLRAFSFQFPSDRQPDSPHYLHAMQQRYGFPLDWIDATDFWAFKEMGEQGLWDEPFILPYEAHWRKTFNLVHEQGMQVVLTGIGGDDVIAISPLIYYRDLLRGLRLRELIGELSSLDKATTWRAAKRLWPALLPRWARALRPSPKLSFPSWLRPEFCERYGLAEWHESRLGPPMAYPNGHAQVLEQLFEQRIRPGLLAFGRLSAQHAIEMRYPFWDIRVVDFMLRVPPEQKRSRGVTKKIFRRSMRGVVPDVILDRRVRSDFSPFMEEGLRNKQVQHVKKSLERPMLADLGIVDAGTLRSAYDGFLEGLPGQNRGLFDALVTESWLSQVLSTRDNVRGTAENKGADHRPAVARR